MHSVHYASLVTPALNPLLDEFPVSAATQRQAAPWEHSPGIRIVTLSFPMLRAISGCALQLYLRIL